VSGMRQLAGTKTRNQRAHATPLAGLISGRAEYNPCLSVNVSYVRRDADQLTRVAQSGPIRARIALDLLFLPIGTVP
jgi:hypothetical protein